MSKVYIGAKFTNKQNSVFEVVAKTNLPKYYVVVFESGYRTTASDSNIMYGKVKDYYQPSVYGVGYLGSAFRIPQRNQDILRKKYDLWANMLKRVYKEYNNRHNYKDVEVSPEWLNFSVFCNEIELVPGYEAWVADSSMCLDKDFAQQRLYSRTTCQFITAKDNATEASERRWKSKAKSNELS